MGDVRLGELRIRHGHSHRHLPRLPTARSPHVPGSRLLTPRLGPITTALSLLVVAVIGPLLGAMADIVGSRKRFLGAALCAGGGSLSLAFLGGNDVLLASLLFAIANLGFAGGNIFYEALLPHISRLDDLDRVSARGYAFGYLGGLLLIINACWLFRPE